jgi:hypothetical protein
MVHHPWVDLFRMRRSMRQINLLAGAPTDATSSFTTSQVAAAAAAAGAALGTGNVSASCPSLANLSQLLQPPSPLSQSSGHASAGDGRAAAPAGPGSSPQHGALSAAAAAAAALNAVKNNLKQTVANKMIAGAHALQGKAADPKPGSNLLYAQMSSASSPCLLAAGKPRGPSNLLKAAMAGSHVTPVAAPVVPPMPQSPAAPAAMAPPGPLHKGGSLKLDADARTFLFAAAFGSSAASSSVASSSSSSSSEKGPGQLQAAANGQVTAAAAKQAAHIGSLHTTTNTFRAAH